MKTRLIHFTSVIALMLLSQLALAQQPSIQYFRSYDKRGVNVFETSKQDSVAYTGFKFRIGAGFTQGFQSLNHSSGGRAIISQTVGSTTNTYIQSTEGGSSFINRVTGAPASGSFSEDPAVYGGYILTPTSGAATQLMNSNQIYQLSAGLPLAQANLNFDVQITDGVRLNLVSYMSSHHHNEFWVKGGYFQIDKVGFLNSDLMNKLWKNLTLKVGHMEVNYGDAHFRRSDGGNTLWNPFMENNIMDEFTTEIGAELYWQKNGWIAMAAMTDGEIQGNVTRPADRAPSIYGKFGYDKQVRDDLRIRLTGSAYTTKSSVSNTIFGGDRTGSNYQYVLQPYNATLTGNAFGGRFNPGYSDNVTTFMVNPFVKYRGLELFGTFESAKGNSALENGEVQYGITKLNASGSPIMFDKLADRKTTQTAVEAIYRFGGNEQFYIGGKYNKVNSNIAVGTANTASYIYQGDRYNVSIDRVAIAAGWFITRNVLFKAEYVQQNYNYSNLEYFRNYSTSSTPYKVDNVSGYMDSSPLYKGKFNGLVIQGVISF